MCVLYDGSTVVDTIVCTHKFVKKVDFTNRYMAFVGDNQQDPHSWMCIIDLIRIVYVQQFQDHSLMRQHTHNAIGNYTIERRCKTYDDSPEIEKEKKLV